MDKVDNAEKIKITADSHWHASGNFAVEPYIAVMTGSADDCADDCADPTVYCEDLPLMHVPWFDINQIEGTFKINDEENLMHRNATCAGFYTPPAITDDDSGQTRRYGIATYTIPDTIAVATLAIPDVEAGDVPTIELRADIHVLASDGRYRGDAILSERIIVDIHVSTFGVMVW